jgi:hypothetical protein
MQERVESGLFKTVIEHKPVQRFVINTHAFHNSHLLRAALERSLVTPILLYPPEARKAKHAELAQTLRSTRAKNKVQQVQPTQASIAPVGEMDLVSKKRARLETEAETTVNTAVGVI